MIQRVILGLCALLAALLAVVSSAMSADDVASRIRTFENALRPAVGIDGESEQRWSLSERMAHWKVPGLSIAVIRDARVSWARGYGVLQADGGEAVDAQTVFSVGSVSKVGAAAITLRLVDAGTLDLDHDVNRYLSRWKVPTGIYTRIRPVTLRGLLSHTAGLTVHGFADYLPGEPLPTVVETLNGLAPAKNGPVEVFAAPGDGYKYSGGGTTIGQLVIEERTGLSFPEAARKYVFEPLGLARSSYVNPLPEAFGNIARAHNREGRPTALPRGYEAMPEMAASGLWTNPSDFAKLVIALIDAYRDGRRDFLSAPLVRQMMTEVGSGPAGLGPFLEGDGMDRRFSHGGANDSYRAWIEGHLATGNGAVIFTNGANGAALYREVLRAIALAEGWSDALDHHVQVPKVSLSSDELNAFVGVYRVVDGTGDGRFRGRSGPTLYEIVNVDGALHIQDGDADRRTRLIPASPTVFVREHGGSTRIEFLRDYGGVVSGLAIGRGKSWTEMKKAP